MKDLLKQEINNLKILIFILISILIIFSGSAFMFNQYILNIYKDKIKEEEKIWRQLQTKINEKEKEISDLLEWNNFQRIKSMQNLYYIYFQNRYKILPKVLVLELLEEILPENAKIWTNIEINENTSVNLVLYTTDITGLDTLYNKFRYYSDVLKLLELKWFDTIILKKNNKEIRTLLWKNSKYIYKTTIQLQLNYDNIRKYYSLLYHPVKNYDEIVKIFWNDIIEPLMLPENITIADSIKLHKLYEEKFVKKKNLNKNENN